MKLRRISFVIFILLSLVLFADLKTEFNVIKSKDTTEVSNLLLDINNVSLEEMLKNGISKGYAEKIIEYRDITGGFIKVKNMTRIAGIGEKTYERLAPKFSEVKNIELKKFNINSIDDKGLIYYGFSKKEVQQIRKYQKNSKIRNNVELKEIISNKKYDELKNYIEY